MPGQETLILRSLEDLRKIIEQMDDDTVVRIDEVVTEDAEEGE